MPRTKISHPSPVGDSAQLDRTVTTDQRGKGARATNHDEGYAAVEDVNVVFGIVQNHLDGLFSGQVLLRELVVQLTAVLVTNAPDPQGYFLSLRHASKANLADTCINTPAGEIDDSQTKAVVAAALAKHEMLFADLSRALGLTTSSLH